MVLAGLSILFIIAAIFYVVCYNRELAKHNQTLSDLLKQISLKESTVEKLQGVIVDYARAEGEAAKELEVKLAQQKADYEQNLSKFKAEYDEEVHRLSTEIAKHRLTVDILNQRRFQDEENKDFIATHSLPMTENEKSDITVFKEFLPRLTDKTIVHKLIWTTFYQGKLQALRKTLGADKVSGIYKITEISTGKSYIGQATDIGERFCQHVKCALGVSFAAPTKFYTAFRKGPENFTFEILEKCSPSMLNEREKFWISFYDTVSFGFNTKAGG